METGGLTDRDRLVATLGARIGHFVRDIDPLILISPEANQELDAITPIAVGPPADPVAASLAGTLTWLSYLAQDTRDVSVDTVLLGQSAGYFLPAYAVDPAQVPEPLHELLQAIMQQPHQFLAFCTRWCEISVRHKGLMLLKEIVARLNDTATGRAESLARLSALLWAQKGNPVSLGSAIIAMEAALREAPPGCQGRAQMEAMLGGQLQDRAVSTNSPADLDSAVAHLRTAAGLADSDPARRPGILADLSGVLQDRYRERFEPPDLAEALAAGERAAAEAPGAAGVIYNYAGALLQKFQASGDLADRGVAIERIREALRLTPPGGDGRALMLTSLAAAIRSGYRQTGSDKDLGEAIDLGRSALDEIRPGDEATEAYCCGTLGGALLTRFQRSDQQADLADGISFAGRAVELTPAGGSRRALWQSNYGGALRARYRRTRDLADLAAAVDLMRQAAAATPVGHPSRALYVINISAATQEMCQAVMSVPALTQAGADVQEVLDSLPDGPAPMRPALLAARGALMTTVYEQTGSDGDLDEALRCCRESVRLASAAGDPHADYAAILASALLSKADHTGELSDQAEALAALLDTSADPAVHLRARISAIRSSARMLASAGGARPAAALLASAVELVTLAVPRQLARVDQEYWLGEFANLAADAAACAVAAEQPNEAVTVLELGRGILIGQSLQLRGAIDELRAVAPELADRFEQIRSELDAPAGPSPELGSDSVAEAIAVFDASRAAAAHRVELAAELDQLADRIRELPGMARFLLRPQFGEIASVASGGPVVFLNVSRLGSHALVLTTAGVTPVPLGSATPDGVAEQVTNLRDAVQSVETAKAQAQVTGGTDAVAQAIAQARTTINGVLHWLWRAVVEPVLTADTSASWLAPPSSGTGGSAQGQSRPPRVWWSPVGALSFLPIHAAVSSDAGLHGALDLVVSSYTPTVAALAQARRLQREPAGDDMLVVAMPATPGAGDLPGAALEAEVLTRDFRVGPVLGSWPLATGQATREAVRNELPRHAFAHFACHASCDATDPTASVLRLQDHLATPLTMADILALSLDRGQLAYLSACETAMTTPRLADEALHLVTAFGLAGYPQVIGTLWRIDDSAGYIMTEQVYQAMSGPGQPNGPGAPSVPQARLAAPALHEATLGLRAQFPDDPIIWAAHIHAGA